MISKLLSIYIKGVVITFPSYFIYNRKEEFNKRLENSQHFSLRWPMYTIYFVNDVYKDIKNKN